MQRNDVQVIAVVCGIVIVCALIPDFLGRFIAITNAAPYTMSFLKFALLATFGECIGLRITKGVYNRPGFGILPKAVVWGFLGVGIKMAFTVFVTGTPYFLAEIGLPVSELTLKTGTFPARLMTAFGISVLINSIFAPIFMTLHKITDVHIANTGGTVPGLFKPVPFGRILSELNWNSLWGFVFKKTLPLFWVPAHTITFMLPPHFQVIFAALLGVVLGVILAFASLRAPQSA